MIIGPNANILIINTAFLGDVALTAVLTQRIKNEFTDSKISVLTTPTGANVLKSIVSIDNLFILDKKGQHKSIGDTVGFAKELSKYKSDIVISLHKSYRTSQLIKHIDAGVKLGFDNASNKRVYTQTVKYWTHQHEAERYQSFLFDDFKLPKIDIKLETENQIYIENMIMQSGFDESKKTITIATGSVWKTKKWGNEKYSELAKLALREYNVIAIGGKEDYFDLPNGVINMMGKTSFEQTFHLLSIADLLVTNDSAPTHFATITNTPTITIFGATHPMFGFSPLASNSTVIQNDKLKCRPCRIHGENKCPLGTHECMTSINVIDVLDKAKQIMSEQ